jgi:hypothetical protein
LKKKKKSKTARKKSNNRDPEKLTGLGMLPVNFPAPLPVSAYQNLGDYSSSKNLLNLEQSRRFSNLNDLEV